MTEDRKCLAVVRVRGVGDASPEIEETLRVLGLNKNCQITLVDNRPSFLGMLNKVRNFVTWGEITEESILALLKERGRLAGNNKVNDEYAQQIGYRSLKDLAAATHKLRADFRHLPDIKPVFRAHPPKKGYKGKIKKSYAGGGVTGYRGQAINKLILNMI